MDLTVPEAPVPGTLGWKPDRAKALIGQVACKEHFSGESEGFRFLALGMPLIGFPNELT